MQSKCSQVKKRTAPQKGFPMRKIKARGKGRGITSL